MAPHLNSYEDCLTYCAQQGMRLSRQRQMILRLLWDTNEHLSAKDIYDRLTAQGEKIGQSSVYQNLNALVRAGAIERVEQAECCLYNHQSFTHSHVHCLDDGSLIDITIMLPPELVTAVEAETGLKVIDYRVEFFAHKALEDDRPSSQRPPTSPLPVKRSKPF